MGQRMGQHPANGAGRPPCLTPATAAATPAASSSSRAARVTGCAGRAGTAAGNRLPQRQKPGTSPGLRHAHSRLRKGQPKARAALGQLFRGGRRELTARPGQGSGRSVMTAPDSSNVAGGSRSTRTRVPGLTADRPSRVAFSEPPEMTFTDSSRTASSRHPELGGCPGRVTYA